MQGQVTYRISEPQRSAAMMAFSLSPNDRDHASDDLARLGDRLAQQAEVIVQQTVQALDLKRALRLSTLIARTAQQEPQDLNALLVDVAHERCSVRSITMAQARLSDGQTLRAVNDLFIGPRSHTSALYDIALGQRTERQSSSGVIVSTGLGSTAWLKSVVTASAALARSA